MLMEKMKDDTAFVRIRSGDHLGDAKNVEKGHLAPSNLAFFINCVLNGFGRMKGEGQIYKMQSQFFLIFDQGLI